MLTLHPGNSFTVVRQIANHLDTDTNYVRAVIRNAYTDEIITTLDLVDRTGQRFSKNWKIPFDPSGNGFYISIVTSVYSDAGYTAKNANYGDEESTYLIQDRQISRGGGTGIDARTVRRIFKEEFTALEEARVEAEKNKEPKKIVAEKKPEKMRWDEVLSEIVQLQKAVIALSEKEPKEFDYKPFSEGIKSILSAVNEKEVTEATDISPILEQFAVMARDMSADKKEMVAAVESLTSTLENLPALISKMMAETTFKIAPSTATMDAPVPKKEEKEEEKPIRFDISKLTT